MSLRAKLIVATLFVALVPLLVSAVTTLKIHQSAFDGKLLEAQRQAALSGAALTEEVVGATRTQLERATIAIPWASLNDAELAGALQLLYQQDSQLAVVTLLDDSGQTVVDSAFRLEEEPGRNPPGSVELRARLYQSLSKAVVADKTVSSAPITDETGRVFQPLLIPVKGPMGRRWVVALAFSLEAVCRALKHLQGEGTVISDGRGGLLCRGTSPGGLEPIDPRLAEALANAEPNVSFSYTGGNTEYLAVYARLSPGWTLAVQHPRSRTLEASRKIQFQTLFWLVAGLVVAIGTGLYLAQGIAVRLRALGRGAEAIGEGELEHRIADDGSDELGRLAGSFNQMSDALARQREEIETWNRELQSRVDERTNELRNAQKQLLESKKLAAMASLAAGFAHEVNNPLTGVLGLAQLLRGRLAKDKKNAESVQTLESIEHQARRIREIVQTLQSLSEESRGGESPVSLSKTLVAAIALHEALAAERGVAVETRLAAEPGLVSGDADSLREAFAALLKNAIAACEGEGQVTVTSESIQGDLIRVTVTDNGVGIEPEHMGRIFDPFYTTKQDWGGQGLGLTLAYRIIEKHRGTLELSSVPGGGTTVTMVFPAQQTAAHLI